MLRPIFSHESTSVPRIRQLAYSLWSQSISKWIWHGHHSYHQSYPYAHMNREVKVWLEIVMNCLIPGLHYMEVTHDRACLVYALMTRLLINTGVLLKSRVHWGRRYAFSRLIIRLCRKFGVLEETVDYMAPSSPYLSMSQRQMGWNLQMDPHSL